MQNVENMEATETPETAMTDDLIRDLGGCGVFQRLFTVLVHIPTIANSFSIIFMSFGNYNPGWTCLDNLTDALMFDGTSYTYNGTTIDGSPVQGDPSTPLTFVNGTQRTILTSLEENPTPFNETDSCQRFESCHNVQFNPEASTIVTEWGLLCDKAWIPSFIISLQMFGSLLGALLVGFLGDTFGRKWTLYSNLLINAILVFISIYSVSWQMFAALKFVIGITNGILSYIHDAYATEFITQKWRPVAASIPSWTIGSIIFAFAAMGLKDWRQLHIINSALCALCFLPVFWVPESIRWLMVKGKNEKALRVVKQIARVNKTTVPDEQVARIAIRLNKDRTDSGQPPKHNTILALFNRKILVVTLAVGVIYLCIDLFYFATSFGISAMPGNFYINLIVISATDMPGNAIASVVPNIFGRKTSLIASFVLMCLSFFGLVAAHFLAPQSLEVILPLVMVSILRTFQNIAYIVLVVQINEFYPTVVRSTANGYGGTMGNVGSILAPYLIPEAAATFYICYLLMGVMSLVCSGLALLLPETKGKQLQDVWTKKKKSSNCDGD